MRRSGLLVIGLLAACGGGSDASEVAGTTTEATTTTVVETTTTAAPDPFTVPADPADIDEAYVEAVLTELERINGDALRLAVSEGLSPAVSDLILSVFNADLAVLQVQILVEDYSNGFAGIRRPPGDVAASVSAISVARRDCISANVILDFSAVATNGVEASPTRIELRPKAADQLANPTPWVYVVRDPISSSTGLPEPCVAS